MNNQTYSDYSNTIIDAVEIIADRIIEQAQFDKTITAYIEELVDDVQKKYRVKYQDSSFFATAEDSAKKYTKGAEVYVLVPGNDFSKNKKILGLVKDLKDSWNVLSDAIDRYEDVGTNIVYVKSKDYEWGISSYALEDRKTGEASISLFNNFEFRENDLKYSLANSDLMEISAEFFTSIDENHLIDSYFKSYAFNSTPNFGLRIKIGENENNCKDYILDVKSMEGSPFKLLNFTKQKVYFQIDSKYIANENFKILDVQLFKKGFTESTTITDIDIKVRELSIKGIKEISLDEYNTYSLRISTPNGESLYSDTDKVSLIANVVYQNSISKLENAEYYWGREDIFIFPPQEGETNEHYNKHLGAGWYYFKEEKTNQLDLKKDKVPFTSKFKCVVIYEDTTLEREITIRTFEGNIEQSKIAITSSNGDSPFYNNEGFTVLTANLSSDLINNNNILYQWVRIDSLNNFSPAGNTKQLEVKGTDVDKNTTFKCGIKDSTDDTGNLLGIASINFKNITKTETNNIVLFNGTQSFLYDVDGRSPLISTTQTTKPLSFEYYDKDGNKVSKNRLSAYWKIPKENSLLEGFVTNQELLISGNKEEDKYYVLSTTENINFTIKDMYSMEAVDNDIILEVVDKNTPDVKSIATTSFTFLKQGESGTNGTNYYAKISILNSDGKDILGNYAYPILDVTSGTLNGYSLNGVNCKAELFFEGDIISPLDSVKWSVIKNINSELKSYFDISSEDGKFSIRKSNFGFNNVLRATIKKGVKTYYAELPIVIVEKSNTNLNFNEIFSFKKNTGFNTIMYAADTTSPYYSKIPFEYSLKEGYSIKKIEIVGSITEGFVIKEKESDASLKENQFKINVLNSYRGETNDTCIYIEIEKDTELLKIYFPLYLYLNRFGFSALNEWDGNNLKINNKDDDGDDYILTPQIAAGTKDNENGFTGLLMGEVKGTKINETGLLGFNSGIRTIFLDAKTGKAEFGAGSGQIILDPEKNQATIKSGNYDTNKKTGMEINLTEPYIKYGSGYFSVDKNGYLVCQNANSIISENPNNTSNFTGIRLIGNTSDSVQKKIGLAGYSNGKETMFLNALDGSASFGAGNFVADAKGNVTMTGKITATSGEIKNQLIIPSTGSFICPSVNYNFENNGGAGQSRVTLKGIEEDDNRVLYVTAWDENSKASHPFVLRGNGALTATNAEITGKITATSGSFSGELKAATGDFSGKITATSGKIGNWTIGANKIYGKAPIPETNADGSNKTDANGNVIIKEYRTCAVQLPTTSSSWVFAAGGTSDSSYSDCPFRVHKDGSLYATQVKGLKGNFSTLTAGKSTFTNNRVTIDASYVKDGVDQLKSSVLIGWGDYEDPTDNNNAWDEITIRPSKDRTGNIGTPNKRWDMICADVIQLIEAPRVTSDRKEKIDIMKMTEKEEFLFSFLSPVIFRKKDTPQNGFHSGFIAQEVEEAIQKAGLTPFNFSVVHKRTKIGENNKPIKDENGNNIYDYSLDYNDFIALNTHMIQKLQKENNELKDKINLLEEKLNQILEKLN